MRVVRDIVQWIMSVCLWSIPVCAIVVMVIYNILYPQHFGIADWVPLLLSTGVLCAAIRYIDFSKFSDRTLTVSGFLILNVAMAVSLLTIDTGVCSDYAAIWDMASKMAEDRYNISEISRTDYEYIFNYQTGIAAFESLFIRCFGATLWPLKIFNALLINITAWLTYRVARTLTQRRVAVYALLMFCTFYPVIITVNQFTNQHIACALILVILLLLRREGYVRWAVAGLVLGLMNVLRPMGVIVILAAALMLLIGLLDNSRSKIIRVRSVISLILFVACSYAVTEAFDALFVRMDYADGPISEKKLPYFKFDKGLTGYDMPEIDLHGGTPEAFNDWERDKLVTTMTHNPGVIVKYVAAKMIRYQGEYDWKFENTYNHDAETYNRYPTKGFVFFGWAEYILAGVLAAMGYRRWRREHGVDIFQIFYVGIVTVYIFIEAFSSYRYESYPILFVFAAYGLYRYKNSKKIQHIT